MMNRIIPVFTVACILITTSSCMAIEEKGPQERRSELLEYVLNLEKPFLKKGDMEKIRSEIYAIVDNIQSEGFHNLLPEDKILRINSAVFRSGRFKIDPEAPKLESSIEFSEGYPSLFASHKIKKPPPIFTDLFKEGKGICVTFSLLYLVLGELLGIQISPVYVPKHMFVRFREGDFRQNIETMKMGKSVSNETYRSIFHLNPDAVSQGVYLADMTSEDLRNYCKCSVADGYIASGEIKKAKGIMADVIRVQPSFIAARLALGWLLLDEGNLEGAEIQAKEVLSNDQKRVAAHQMLFVINARRKNLKGHLESVLEIHERNYFALLELGKYYAQAGNVEIADEWLDKTERQFPGNSELMCLQGIVHWYRRMEGPEEYFKKAIELDEGDPRAWSWYGRYKLMSGDVPGGMKMLHKSVLVSPDYLDGKKVLAIEALKHRMYPVAEKYAKEVLETQKDTQLNYTLGIAYLFQRKIGHAKLAFSKARKLGLRSATLNYLFAMIHIMEGKNEEAKQEISDGLDNIERDLRLRALLALIMFKSGQIKRAKFEIRRYTRDIKIKNDHQDVSLLNHEIELLREYEFGILVMNELISSAGYIVYYSKRGYYFEKCKKFKEAIADYNEYIDFCGKVEKGWMTHDYDKVLGRLESLKKEQDKDNK